VIAYSYPSARQKDLHRRAPADACLDMHAGIHLVHPLPRCPHGRMPKEGGAVRALHVSNPVGGRPPRERDFQRQ